MPRKTGTLRREQQPTTRPQVAGIVRAEAREQRRRRRDLAAALDRRTTTTTTINPTAR